MEFFSKIVKMGERLYVQVPTKNLPEFVPGDPVWVRKVVPPPKGAENV